ncbi:MAG: glycosyltransferase [Bacteroidia bacterium]|nr:glycosyltransferase [Bacteroidia bacterium]
MQYLEYFEKLAPGRIRIRKKHAYYWNDITYFCNYFSHETLSVLEVGCGTGELLNEIKGRVKTGIDFSPAMIEQAGKQFPNLDLRVMAAEDIRLEQQYDLIILSNLIGYVSDIQIVLEQLHKVCHERTKIIITYHNHVWEPVLKMAERAGLKTKSPVQNWLTKDDMKNLLMLAGFDCYRQTGRMIFPVNIPLLSPFLNKFIGKLPFFKYFAITGYAFARPFSAALEENTTNKHSVSIVIPARNESGNIENGLLRIPEFGKWQEIIFVEGNSTDDTWEKIRQVKEKYTGSYRIKIAKQDGKGKADAVRKGFSIAEGDVLMILDADLTVPPEDLPKFYHAIASGKGDFINGSRLVYPMEKQAMRFLNMLGNKFFSRAFSWLLEQPFKDTLCGTKVILRSDYEKLVTNRKFFGEFDPFGDYDLIFGAYKLNLKIVELPIRYRDRTYGSTNISRFKHGLILLRMCLFAARKIKFQ